MVLIIVVSDDASSAMTVGMINKVNEQIKLVNFISYKFILGSGVVVGGRNWYTKQKQKINMARFYYETNELRVGTWVSYTR